VLSYECWETVISIWSLVLSFQEQQDLGTGQRIFLFLLLTLNTVPAILSFPAQHFTLNTLDPLRYALCPI